jgi:hypothetical protein
MINYHAEQSDNREVARRTRRRKYSKQVKPIERENRYNRDDSDVKA